MSRAETLLSRLEGVRQTGTGRWMARCPTRDERTASLSIRETDDGRVLLNDFGGDSVDAILSAVGLSFNDLFPEPLRGATTSRVPPFDRQGFRDATRTTLTALCVAAKDIEAGREISATDRKWIAAESARLLSILNSEVRHVR